MLKNYKIKNTMEKIKKINKELYKIGEIDYGQVGEIDYEKIKNAFGNRISTFIYSSEIRCKKNNINFEEFKRFLVDEILGY